MKSRNRVNSYAARITKMIADIEDRHHGPSDAMHNPPQPLRIFQKISVSFLTEIKTRYLLTFSLRDTYPIILSFTHCGNKSILRVLRIILVILPEHPSETIVFHNEDGNPARANIKQALGRPHKGVKASANSDVKYSFTSAQDGEPLQDDNTMAEQNVPAQAQQMSRLAFSASASVPAVYIQQFWNSMKYDEKTGVYCCQVDEQWFNLSADLLRKALDITPVDPAHPFELPPTGDTVIDFVNQLGYPEPVEFVSNIRVNYVYQPWRAILTLINQCLTGKTSGGDKPRHPVLQMLWGIVTQTNVDHAELLWEEFTQGIQTFFSHKASHKASLKDPKKKAVPLLIPYGRFTKMIIYYLGSTSDVHKRPESPCHLPGDDFLLGNLKFISKGETDEVFGMAIPKQLITQAIQQSSYYPKYLEMVAKNTKKTPQDSASKQPEPATKRAPPKKPTTTTPVKPTKPPSSKQPKSPTKKPSKRKLPQKVRKGKPSFQLVDEDDEAQQESVPQGESDDPALELAKKMSLDAHQEKGEGEGADADIERAIKLSLDPSFLPQGQAPVGGVAIRDPVSETTPKLPEVVGKGKAIVTEEQVAHSLIDLSKKKRTTDQFILVRRDQAPHDSTTGPSSQPEDDTSEKVVHESSSTTDSE
ncbi:hypothetical protein Tco_0839652 [Tanacetum coccineum]|uniref:Monodehydroascorbate reductase n=1 Tax=Tanacetum coccineum TaxID=301880 RepID=A0ABQ5ARV1_9ASTR